MIKHTAIRKYWYYLLHFATLKKLINILQNQGERYIKRAKIKSKPYKFTIDPSNFCNLRCPGCHTGVKHPDRMKSHFLPFEKYKTVFNKIEPYALSVSLYNWGEPLLNKDLFKIIAYTRSKKVGTTIHSNLNHFNQQMAENLVQSGLTHLYLSIDGATQETYSKYRVKGNIDVVLQNVSLLVEAKRKLKSKLPFITWKFLVFDFNKHEIEQAHQLSKTIGVNNFKVYTANTHLMDIYDEAQNYKNNVHLLSKLNKPCKSLWSSLYVGPDGALFPCSLSFRASESFGNLVDEDFLSVYNNTNYQNARKMFSENIVKESIPMPCRGCKHAL